MPDGSQRRIDQSRDMFTDPPEGWRVREPGDRFPYRKPMTRRQWNRLMKRFRED